MKNGENNWTDESDFANLTPSLTAQNIELKWGVMLLLVYEKHP